MAEETPVGVPQGEWEALQRKVRVALCVCVHLLQNDRERERESLVQCVVAHV